MRRIVGIDPTAEGVSFGIGSRRLAGDVVPLRGGPGKSEREEKDGKQHPGKVRKGEGRPGGGALRGLGCCFAYLPLALEPPPRPVPTSAPRAAGAAAAVAEALPVEPLEGIETAPAERDCVV